MGNDMMEAYLYEMNTLLEQVDEIVLSAEKNGSFSEDEVNEIFRIMHTFKGSSAMMEFNSLMTVAHRVEDLFFIIRDKTMEVIPEGLRPELFDLIFQAIDFFRGEVEKIDKWGVKRFTYPINFKNEGFYVLMTFTASPELPKEIERQMGISDAVYRFMTTRAAN